MKRYSGGVRHDYKDSDTPERTPLVPLLLNRRGLHWFAVGLVLPLLAVMLLLGGEPDEPVQTAAATASLTPNTQLALLAPGERTRLALPPPANSGGAGQLLRPEQIERNALLAQGELITLTVRSGDSLDRMFRRNDLSISDLAAMVDLPEGGPNLARLNPGDKIEVIRDGERVLALSRELSQSQRLWIRRADTRGVDIVAVQGRLSAAGV